MAVMLSSRTALRILLVEDHDDSRLMMVRLLGAAGYAVVAASGYAEALTKAQDGAFDVLIADLGLPDGSGWELPRRLRDEYRFAAIAVSGHGTPADIERSRAAGYCDHLIKPINFDQLLATVAHCHERESTAA
jgi:CheY-like chemotaxis protein